MDILNYDEAKKYDGVIYLKIAGIFLKIDNYAFKGNSVIKMVTIPEGIVSVGEEAFADCENLRTVILPNSICYISENAFKNSGVRMKLPLEHNLKEFTSIPTIAMWCKENSYADFWLKNKKKGFIITYYDEHI